MEQELIIAEILRNKPQGIKLYSPIFGACTFCYIKDESSDICVRRPYNEISYFNFDGVYHTGGECLLFPSKEMQDWSRFAWKKGDVLVNENNAHIIFEKFSNDTYTTFIGKYYSDGDDKSGYSYISGRYTACTQQFHIEKDDTVQTYISNIEKEIGGKLDLKTLEIEKEQPEFKDGDIVVAEEDNYYDKVIFISAIKDDIVSKVLINVRYKDYEVHYNEYRFGRNRSLRLVTDSEKQQLFDALAKEGKAWDAEKKMIIDLKPKVEFKPFDKVLVRDSKANKWRANLFSHKNIGEPYYCVYASWNYCIPYKGNEHLLGTTKDSKQNITSTTQNERK